MTLLGELKMKKERQQTSGQKQCKPEDSGEE